MSSMFSDRIADVPRSFIREILKVAIDPSVISFAGGLPNRELFPVAEVQAATNKVFESSGKDALQYANSEGYAPLRAYISDRYRKKRNLQVPVANILITSGSQQGLDLLGKIFLNEGDGVAIEEPGYLGAIQAFSLYQAAFHPIPLSEKGIDLESLHRVMTLEAPKLLYTVPNFQNPSGITWPEENRQAAADIIKDIDTLLIEDDPYGELRFEGSHRSSFYSMLPEKTILLGSFSKIIAPGLRLGWIAAPDQIMDKLIVAKQASDLHSNHLAQRIIYQYLEDNDLEKHIERIATVYNRQRLAMFSSIKEYLPPEVTHTTPEGGMFLWLTLPKGISSMRLFDRAIAANVAFVPGNPFYVNGRDTETLRLNFSCVEEATIAEGIRRLGKSVKVLIG
ncbi:MAG: PLP-dependent aminotransferase family protein [Desulforhabdus sp.]|jgi:2-aminoadipate transaminase|nr:PLP-dependent aminotransferase family protein [Desulforhabdus sp.]